MKITRPNQPITQTITTIIPYTIKEDDGTKTEATAKIITEKTQGTQGAAKTTVYVELKGYMRRTREQEQEPSIKEVEEDIAKFHHDLTEDTANFLPF